MHCRLHVIEFPSSVKSRCCQVMIVTVSYYVFFRMDQACGVHSWVREHPPVPQPAPGDLWRDGVEHPGHRGAPDGPHREGLRQRQLLWQICATPVWWVLFYRWKREHSACRIFSFYQHPPSVSFRCCQRWGRPPPSSVTCCQLDLRSAHSAFFWFISGLLLQRVQPRRRGAGFSRLCIIGRPFHPAAVDAKGWSQHPAFDHSDSRKSQRGGDDCLQHRQERYVMIDIIMKLAQFITEYFLYYKFTVILFLKLQLWTFFFTLKCFWHIKRARPSLDFGADVNTNNGEQRDSDIDIKRYECNGDITFFKQ